MNIKEDNDNNQNQNIQQLPELLDIKQEEKIINKEKKPPKRTNTSGKYIGFYTRIITYSIIFIISLTLSIFCITKSLTIDKEKYINYEEKSNIDYKVNLKSNNFYETPYLEKDMIYIASLIKSIDINYLYDFTITEPSTIKFNYDVVGKLEIVDPVDKQVYFEKEYILLKNQQKIMNKEQKYYLNQPITIDYNYYNSLANSFKSTYGVDSESNLIVYLRIKKQNTNDSNNIKLNDQSNMSLTIPLSEKAINIKMDYKEINASKKAIKNQTIKINNILWIILSIIFLVIAIKSIYRLLKILPIFYKRPSLYDNYIKKILTEYDRLIVESVYCPEFEKFNLIKVKKITELVDVHDNLTLQILYYEVTKHQKSYFYIKKDKDIYLTVIKAVDLEVKDEKK